MRSIAKERLSRNKGFTLIEMLVVVALIALIFAVAMPRVSGYFKVSLNSTTRQLATLVKETYNSAVMTGKVYRLVYDVEHATYWVEVGPRTALLDTAQSREKEEHRKKWASAFDKEKAPPSEFQMATSLTRDKKSLPRGVTFTDVQTEQSPEPVTTGLAYTHFFPHGVTEQTLIHLKDTSDHQISLIISPLIGRTKLVDRYVTQKEAYDY